MRVELVVMAAARPNGTPRVKVVVDRYEGASAESSTTRAMRPQPGRPVQAFYRAALEAGGISRREPRFWPEYRAYAAFVSDPDGNNIEALVKES